jgi:hypothetical protein
MGYVLVAILLILILIAGSLVFLRLNARRSPQAAAEDTEDAAGTPFTGRDSTPLGDTAQHSDAQDA